MVKTGKKIFYSIWIFLVLGFVVYSIQHPHVLEPQFFKSTLEQYGKQALIVYVFISFIRGIFLIPSTAFVLGGALLFPEKPITVLMISLMGILFSASCLYYFSNILGFSEYLEKKYPHKMAALENKLQQPNAIYFIILWAFLPVVPTDLICYLSGILKIPYRNMIAGIFIGEIVLCSIYIYFCNSIF